MKVRFQYLSASLCLAVALSGLEAKALETKARVEAVSPAVTRARALITNGSYDAAISELTKAIALSPQNVDLYIARSLAYGAKGDYLKADADRTLMQRLSRDNPSRPLKRSLQDFQALASRQPKSVAAYNNLGEIYFYLADSDASPAYMAAGLKSFEKARALDPKSIVAYNGIGFIRLLMGDEKRALESFNRAIALNPSFPWSYGGRGSIYNSQGKSKEAIKEYNAILKISPKNSNAYSMRGVSFLNLKEYKPAIADLDRAIQIDPLDANSYFNRAIAKFNGNAQRGRFDAVPDLDVALKLAPKNANAYYWRGVAYSAQEEYDAAIKDFTASVTLKPENAPFLLARAEAYLNKGVKAEGESKKLLLDKALADYNQVTVLNPNDTSALISRGAIYLGKGNAERALGNFNRAIEVDPNIPLAYELRAQTYISLQENEKVLADYRQLLVLDPNHQEAKNRIQLAEVTQAITAAPENPENYLKRADIYVALANPEAALADFDAAIKLAPDNAAYLNRRGVFYANRRETEKALADIDAAIKQDPNFIKAYENRMAMKTESAQAIADTTEIIRIDPRNIAAYTKRAQQNSGTEDSDKALADYAKVLEIDPRNASAYESRASLYLDRQELDKAIADYSAVLRINPQNSDIYSKRGMAYLQKGDLVKAEADFKRVSVEDDKLFKDSAFYRRILELSKAIATNPNNGEAYLARARAVIKRERFVTLGLRGLRDVQYTQVIGDLTKAIELNPQKAEPYALRAQIYSVTYASWNDPDKAIADATKGLQLDPKNAALFNLRGLNFMTKGKYESAVADYFAAMKLDAGYAPGDYHRFSPDEEVAPKIIAYFDAVVAEKPRSAQAVLYRGVIHAETEKWDRAIADYSKAIQLDPKSATAYFLRGMIYNRQSASNKQTDIAKAMADFSKAIQLDPQLAPVYYQRASHWSAKEEDKAIADYTTFIRLSPRYAGHAYVKRSRAYGDKKQWAKSLADLDATSRFPMPITTEYTSNLESSIQDGKLYAYLGLGQYDKAIALYTEVLKAPPFGSYAYYFLKRGDAFLAKGEAAKAIADFNAAITRFPDIEDTYAHRAIAYRKTGQFERAAADEVMARVLGKKA